MDRIILHCDLNAFYASVECLYRPDVAHLPVAVGGDEQMRHGIVLAKNEKAKAFGIATGEPLWKAREKCPGLVILPPHSRRYLHFSKLARNIYQRYTNRIEPFGIDEAWLDITERGMDITAGRRIADDIRETVQRELGVTVSVGVSFNKVFAKLGSDLKKPNGTTVIARPDVSKLVWPLPGERLLFVGRSAKNTLHKVGLFTIRDIAHASPRVLKGCLGKVGENLWRYANGLDDSPVAMVDETDPIKGLGNSITTARNLTRQEEIRFVFAYLAQSVSKRLRKQGLVGSTLQIYVRFSDLSHLEHQGQLPAPTQLEDDLIRETWRLFQGVRVQKPIRALGIRLTQLQSAEEAAQLSLLWNEKKRRQRAQLEQCLDQIHRRFGPESVRKAPGLDENLLSLVRSTGIASLPGRPHAF